MEQENTKPEMIEENEVAPIAAEPVEDMGDDENQPNVGNGEPPK